MFKMSNFPVKSLAYLLQVRSLFTSVSKSKLKLALDSTPNPNPNPITRLKVLSKPKTRRKDPLFLLSKKEESVIALLKKHQFTDAQIASLVQRSPAMLKCKLESNLEPKLRFLNDNGFVGVLLTDAIVKNPLILRRSLNDHLIPNYEYLKAFMRNDQAAVLFVVKRANWLMTCDLRKVLQPNVELLLKESVEMSSILKLFTSQPRSFLCPVERMSYGIETVKKFGVKPTDSMFIHALRVVLSMNESNLRKKLDIMRDLGWSEEDIASTMARQPLALSQSEDKLRSTFEFFVNTMRLKPEDIIHSPKLLMYSLSNRSIPRCKVIMALKEKKLMKDMHIPSLINMPGEDFTRKFILKFPTLSSSLWILYLGNRKVDGIAVE